jgi:2-keto-4-pentenoate hydratase/2-oxohepta-3-ene-1,7-dioic acid hydratase in catechol pathway
MHNIWAVGRNYSDHAKEFGSAVPSAAGEPMIFLKAGTCVVANGASFALPAWSTEVHFETELALQFAANPRVPGGVLVDAFTIALDLTARDAQNLAKQNGTPWTLAKSFRDSCPLGDWKPAGGVDLQNLEFSLKIDGVLKQKGCAREMIFAIPRLVQYLSERFPVAAGDILLTGTPAGVGPLHSGDRLQAQIHGHLEASWIVK